MATIKSYTDISQSKRLAKILPIESADMCINSTNPYMIFTEVRPIEGFDDEHDPCWSLAALLGVIQKNTPYTMQHFGDKKVQLVCDLGDKPWELIISDFNNEVDACYEMILKLHELNLL